MIYTPNKFVRILTPSALFSLVLVAALSGGALFAQNGGVGKEIVQQKLAAIKASTAENQQKLHQYTWTETSQVTLNGDTKPAKESTCSYGPDGKVQKVPIGGTVEPASNGRGGRFKQRIVEKKTSEMKDYMQQVGHVIALYLPPNSQKMQQAFQDKKVTVDRASASLDMVFKDYALPGDSMTIDFDTATKKIRSLNVHSYLNTPADAVTLFVTFASLPDGTNHPAQTTLDAPAKNIRVVNTNSNYRKTGL